MKTHISIWRSILNQLSFSRNADWNNSGTKERWRRVDKGLRIDFYPDEAILYVFSSNSKAAERYNCPDPENLFSVLHQLNIH